MTLTLKKIGPRDSLLSEVITLGGKNSKTLGMFPEGAFMDHAKKKTIFAAVDENSLAGYVLFRIVHKKRQICITHLCIASEYRNRGVAKILLGNVKDTYKDLFQGISLTCREDYEGASKLWKKFGFKPVDRKRSRSKDERYLIKWLYDFGNPDLFFDSNKEGRKVRALLDCNVLIPMSDESSGLRSEIESLFADWLEEEAEFLYAQEAFSELNRDKNKVRAAKTRNFLKKFSVCKFRPDERDKIFASLATIMPDKNTNDTSDRLQLAECIGAGIGYFITLDERLVNHSDDLFSAYSLRVLRPTEFILLIDELSNSLDYHSLRLSGANYDYGKLKGDQMGRLLEVFVSQNQNERRHTIRAKMSKCASDPSTGTIKVVKDKDGNEIGFYSVLFDHDLKVVLLRTVSIKIALVLFQQLVKDIISLANAKGICTIRVEEHHLSASQKGILSAMGFQFVKGIYQKVSLKGLYTTEELLDNEFVKANFDTSYVGDQLNRSEGSVKEILKLGLERKLWPAKVSDLAIPIYIIPIKPLWAGQLFDYYIADSDLFGARPTLAWNRENVYYRSVKPVSEKAPGRILWYLSSDNKSVTGRRNGIVACSYLDEVYVNRVKVVFEKFKLFGVYEWKDVYKLAKRQILSDIKAIKFSNTEVFRNIIPLSVVDRIMQQHNRPVNTFASPVEVSTHIFNEVYKLAINE